MAAITNYTSLAATIDEWDERTHDSAQLIGLAEAEFRLHLTPSYAKEASTNLTFVSGSAAIPSGFVRPLSLTSETYGALEEKGIGYVRERRTYQASGIPDCYALTATTIEVAPSYDGDLTFDFEANLTGLSASNETNWLITNGPQAYLAMCMYFAKAKFEDPNAGSYYAQAINTVDALTMQSTVAQYGNASMTLRGATP